MSTRKLKIDEVQPGHQIAADVTSKGLLLVQRGTRLTDTLIRSLERRGVSEIEIRDGDAPHDPASDETIHSTTVDRHAETRRVEANGSGSEMSARATETLNRATVRLDAIFQPWAGDGLMESFKAAGVQFWTVQAQKLATQPMGAQTKRLFGKGS